LTKAILDKKDMRIVELVTEDGRLPLKQIASKVQLSREAVSYRIKRLEGKNILRNCVAKIDMTKFYQSSYYILFRFRNTSRELQKERIKFLVESPYVMWVGALIDVNKITITSNNLLMFKIFYSFSNNARTS